MVMNDAFKVMDDEGNTIATVWWTGSRIQADNPKFLARLKTKHVDGLSYGDGKEFFDKIPNIYKSGYTYTKKAKVDADGKLIQD